MSDKQKPSKLLRVVEAVIDAVGLVMLIIPLILRRRKSVRVTISRAEAEGIVDTINDLADYVEESGHPLRAERGRETAEKFRKQIVKQATKKDQ